MMAFGGKEGRFSFEATKLRGELHQRPIIQKSLPLKESVF